MVGRPSLVRRDAASPVELDCGEPDELGVAANDRVRGAEDDDVSLTDGDDDGVRRVIRPSDGLRGLVSDAFDGAALPRSTDECVVAAVAR